MRARKTESFPRLLAILFCLAQLLVLQSPAAIQPSDLRCEYALNPVGVETARPQLSWELKSREHNQRQSAYQILVTITSEALAADQGDLWDSGQVKSSESVHVPYGGAPLSSRQRCWWKVRVWDGDGKLSDWTQPLYGLQRIPHNRFNEIAVQIIRVLLGPATHSEVGHPAGMVVVKTMLFAPGKDDLFDAAGSVGLILRRGFG